MPSSQMGKPRLGRFSCLPKARELVWLSQDLYSRILNQEGTYCPSQRAGLWLPHPPAPFSSPLSPLPPQVPALTAESHLCLSPEL